MKFVIRAALVLALFPFNAGVAQERQTLGYGSIFSNDRLGDGKDRWRSGSYSFSKVTGRSWDGVLPSTMGEILEYRLRAEIFAPESLTNPSPQDRRYAGALSFGLHTHFGRGGTEISYGADLVVTGSQTGIASFQDTIHDWIDEPSPDTAADNQIGNAIYPTISMQAARPFHISQRARMRPFIEAQAGVETFLRIGGDLVIGNVGAGELTLRDVTTGHLYGATYGGNEGVSMVLGADTALMVDSRYLPSHGNVDMSTSRTRLRAGMHWEAARIGIFYGLTWLSEEFDEQSQGQTLGTLNLRYRF
ncbi:MAG: hypothetical protein CL814_05275 [Confluentimicrobium sp.]|uniref:lipid A-modifier LpxR family protein n=1 Tax=Actibacterium sp. TaxID=1872125 RepID=UPI000C4E52A4|nr:lipid A-modifier LpxR family protein [Actibacterium sp.]MBC56329.1 hypothetical protein [Actibacterium sp.]MDY6858393.1 DUF2219 family protein [Pseudomonadota bacterium]|tara:strand:+ start:2326 stop:3237 length:912 start_codon:yes stop_codon:yes gene_type:complete